MGKYDPVSVMHVCFKGTACDPAGQAFEYKISSQNIAIIFKVAKIYIMLLLFDECYYASEGYRMLWCEL